MNQQDQEILDVLRKQILDAKDSSSRSAAISQFVHFKSAFPSTVGSAARVVGASVVPATVCETCDE